MEIENDADASAVCPCGYRFRYRSATYRLAENGAGIPPPRHCRRCREERQARRTTRTGVVVSPPRSGRGFAFVEADDGSGQWYAPPPCPPLRRGDRVVFEGDDLDRTDERRPMAFDLRAVQR